MTTQESLKNNQEIHVKISDNVVLTPELCAKLINEILKGVLYQKNQIPYPFNWLKSIVERKRRNENDKSDPKLKVNMTVENHFRVVSTAYDTLDKIMKELVDEFKENGNNVKEVVVVFGTTPQFAKEIFTIKVPPLSYEHYERNHVSQLHADQQKILRNIFLSQSWMDSIDHNISCTYTYIFLKKSATTNNNSNSFFSSTRPLTFLPKAKQINLSFTYKPSETLNCCSNLLVFEEDCITQEKSEVKIGVDIEKVSDELMWCQAQSLLKGFQDCFINKVSACELW